MSSSYNAKESHAFNCCRSAMQVPIYAFTNNEKILNSLSILWGVRPMLVHTFENINIAINHSIEILKKKQLIKDNDIVVHLGSIPLNLKGQTNMLKVSYV